MYDQANVFPQVTATEGVGEAVGIPERKWFVAFVGHNTEKACRDRLQKLGYEAFVASQEEEHHWANGRKRKIERILISTIIFVRASEAERRTIVKLPYIHAFLTDKAGRPTEAGIRPLAVIPDKQMDMLRFMLYQSERPVEFVATPLSVGDHIHVLRGAMAGLQGEVVTLCDGAEPRIGVRIDFLGYATLHISPEDVEKLTA
ncbi:MAG: UpxY family transcription antiterminator [Bacteroidaceae bacterium]|nr:UpxY family transcription antiterminator [Bacteroidaceae bacterium]